MADQLWLMTHILEEEEEEEVVGFECRVLFAVSHNSLNLHPVCRM